MWPIKMYVISTLCSVHNAKISRHIGLLQNVITRWILKITQQYFGFIHYNIYSSMSNCFWCHRNIFIFDPKCKLSDTPDCDWHDSKANHHDVMETFFCVSGPLRKESTGHLWIPLIKSSDPRLGGAVIVWGILHVVDAWCINTCSYFFQHGAARSGR